MRNLKRVPYVFSECSNILKRINVFKPNNNLPTYSSFNNFPLKVQILAKYSKSNNKRYPVLSNPFQMAHTNITRGAPVQYSNKRQITTYFNSLMRNGNDIQAGLKLRDCFLKATSKFTTFLEFTR
jgi:hypothetical protein